MNTLYLVRHADAGSALGGPTRLLNARGRSEAQGLCTLLAGRPIERILCSPLARCIETAAPLRRERGLELEVDEAYAEGADLQELIRRVEALDGPALLCSHGDLIPGLLDHWRRSGLDLDPAFPCQKGSVWVVEMEGGAAVTADYLLPHREPTE